MTTHTHRSVPTWLSLACLLAAGGCASGRAANMDTPRVADVVAPELASIDTPDPEPTFTFTFTPSVPPGGLCTIGTALKTTRPCAEKHCLRAKRGDFITFGSSPPGDFELAFDPFKDGTIKVHGDKTLKVHGEAFEPGGPSKPYSFVVTAPGCTPLDPKIIIEN